MGFKTILVLLDGARDTENRVYLAVQVAQRFDAHLVGLYLSPFPGTQSPCEASPPYEGIDPRWWKEVAKVPNDAHRVRELFEDITRRHAVPGEWRSAGGLLAEKAAVHARYADLVILGQINPDDPWAAMIRPAPDEVIFRAGRPALVIPYIGGFDRIGSRILIGWDAGREATRAVSDALPLLERSASVTIVTIDPKPSDVGHGEQPGADIGLYLARHGINTRVENTRSAGVSIGDILLSRCSDIEADLLVMGAYGHSRVRELLLGGATRTVLNCMTVPVLMTH